ncbi:MAG: shikimate dehydrogenase [Clostridia bacterium]|nr:shikimate dehydrogenase [Clostridia bacterium]
MMKYGCIGETLSHSYSVEIHTRLSEEPYELRELSKEELPGFFAARKFFGINVTIPYKEAVIPYLDGIDDLAGEIGAVNTILNREGKLIGYNTDFDGLTALLSRMDVTLSGKRVMIVGSGGTAKTARALAKRSGACEILTVSRTKGVGDLTYQELPQAAKRIQVLIQTTPVGMYPGDGEMPVDLDLFPKLEALVDAVYHPIRTRLVLEARERGIKAEGGLFMLVFQAAKSASLFHDTSYSDRTIESVYHSLLQKKENLVLIGMPGAGKTTLGGMLAERLGRPFFDLDKEVGKRVGETIPELFAKGGEAAFRAIETVVTKELSRQDGVVIATGGGTPLERENLLSLRQNGFLYYLDRPQEELLPSDDRPLARTRKDLAALYDKRTPRYRAICNAVFQVHGSPLASCDELEKDWRNR